MPPRKKTYCAMMTKGGKTFPVCNKSSGAKKNFSRHKITKGYSSGKRIMRKTAKKAKAKKPQTQTAIKRLMKLRRRKAANKRYVAKKKAGTVRKAGSRTGTKYRK